MAHASSSDHCLQFQPCNGGALIGGTKGNLTHYKEIVDLKKRTWAICKGVESTFVNRNMFQDKKT
eukprot:5530151-Amphidinium_carterae.1